MSTTEFMRFCAPDPQRLLENIACLRQQLAAAGSDAVRLEHCVDLAASLTVAHHEAEALALLEKHEALAVGLADQEAAAWFWNAWGTALQYLGRRSEAPPFFERAVSLARDAGWHKIHAMTLHHWGRLAAEQRDFARAESLLRQALELRVLHSDPLQESSRRALQALKAYGA